MSVARGAGSQAATIAPPPPVPPADPTPRHVALAFVGTYAAYVLIAWISLLIAVPPSFAAPLFPAAGVALACVLTYGMRMLPAIALGSLTINAGAALSVSGSAATALAGASIIAVGAALQAGLGAALVKRVLRAPVVLAEPRDIALFFVLGALVACVVSPSIAVSSFALTRTVPLAHLPEVWLTWWGGDTMGTLIGAPVTLTLIGRPRADWAPRRISVGLTLALVTAAMGLTVAQIARWDAERVRSSFERDASGIATALSGQLRLPLDALEALYGVFDSSNDVTRDEMHRATRAWLADGALSAMGWSEHVNRVDVPAFEQTVRAEGLPSYRVFDRPDHPPPPATGDVVAIRYIEPMQRNAAALGVNVLSIPMSREAIGRTASSGRPAASEGFRLTQDRSDSAAEVGLVVYRALFRGEPSTPEARNAALRGVTFVTLRPRALVTGLLDQFPKYLTLCIVDQDPAARQHVLFGAVGCDTQKAEMLHEQPVDFAGRRWTLRITAPAAAVPDVQGANARMFALIGLPAAGLLGALLLTVTGRTRRIEEAVLVRTTQLRAEVNEREQAEAAMRESERRLRNILNHVPIGVIYTDVDGTLRQSNPSFRELTGYAEGELIGINAEALTHPDDLAADREATSRLLAGEIATFRTQKRLRRRDGSLAFVQSTVSLLRDEAGAPRRIVAAVEDISEHLRLEEAERARERAEAANLAKSDFLSRMSHELRTPLNAMLGFAQLLELDQRHPLSTTQRPWVAQIQQAGWHLLDMINDVLDLSRIESGNLRLEAQVLDLPELLAASSALVASAAARRGVVFSTDLGDGTAALLGDPTRVKQILTNLFSNAVKYNVDGGRVHVATRVSESGMVEIAVTDTGIGMTPPQMAELFQPFNRLGRDRSAVEGTGIGLVISRRLAELMGGSLEARSTAGEGSSFILALPRVPDPDTVPSPLDSLALAEPGYHRRLVHYVEDNEMNVEVMRGMVAQRPQVELGVSTTGLEGLAAIRARRPDVVLLDMNLPDISGMELLRRLKAEPATAHLPVVVVSADALPQQIGAALAAGATRYLTKPVSITELMGVLDDLLGQAETRFG